MKIQRRFGTISGLAVSFAMLPLFGVTAHAQDTTAPAQQATAPAPQAAAPAQHAAIEGLIVGRDGPTMSVKTADNPRLTVVLSDSTKATEKGGFLGWDRTDPGITALVPGLSVKVEGSYDPDHKLIAQKVTFTRSSMKVAKQVEAGINPTNEKVAAAQDAIRTNQKNLELAQQAIDANTKDIAKNGADIDAHTQAIAANTAAEAVNKDAIGKANNRFGTLDQYEIKGNITVNFANGKATVSPKDRDQLTEFVKAAADTPGFMIQIQGYASTVGSPMLNQRLSAERAEAVTAIIQQTGAVPLTRILAPAAMGTSEQVGDNHKRAGQAQNRRVVVTILVNKGITG
jgi:outer membrane protein OmpA-like peptidoglycan-associated protein